jgi:DNA modification methylase
MSRLQILTGDCRDILPTLEAGSVQMCCTSPPYWNLRDYGTAQWEGGDVGCDHRGPPLQSDSSTLFGNGHGNGKPLSPSLQVQSLPYRDQCGKCGARRIDSQLGLESTPEEYIANMVAVFREVWRVLRDDGTCWINLGDTMLPDKNEADIPHLVKLALKKDGWIARSTIIWHKPNPMPESVINRPTKAHEYIFLLTKAERYFYDADAIREPGEKPEGKVSCKSYVYSNGNSDPKGGGFRGLGGLAGTIDSGFRNKRSVWTIATQPFSGAHFATFPEEIPKLCILAGSKPGDTVLDPFAGSGTVGKVAMELGRKAVLIELNPAYIELAKDRTFVTPGFL